MTWKLLAHLALLPVCAWALVEVFSVSSTKASMGIAIWLLAAAILHDFLLLPLYSGADRVAQRALMLLLIAAGAGWLMWGVVRRLVAPSATTGAALSRGAAAVPQGPGAGGSAL